jgi:hypothetical protein
MALATGIGREPRAEGITLERYMDCPDAHSSFSL